MIAEEAAIIAAAKVAGASAVGSVIALRFLPGTVMQRTVSFISSLGLGCICGMAAAEKFALAPGSGMQLLVTASASIFGLAIISNAMTQVPEVVTALRKRFVGE